MLAISEFVELPTIYSLFDSIKSAFKSKTIELAEYLTPPRNNKIDLEVLLISSDVSTTVTPIDISLYNEHPSFKITTPIKEQSSATLRPTVSLLNTDFDQEILLPFVKSTTPPTSTLKPSLIPIEPPSRTKNLLKKHPPNANNYKAY